MIKQTSEYKSMPAGRAADRASGDDRLSERRSAGKYKLGVFYSICTAMLLGAQDPFSATAAKQLTTEQFVCVTQIALLCAVPLMLMSETTRRDFKLLATVRNVGKVAALFAIGLTGLVLYNFGLAGAHPVIIAAILNLSPFWAALVARVIAQKPIPTSPALFFGCLCVAFAGAMIIAWSQISDPGESSLTSLRKAVLHGTWIYAVPVPIFYALSGSLVRKWFADVEESASVAFMFVLSAALLIPGTLYLMHLRSETLFDKSVVPALALLLIGTLIAAAAGRVVYQLALSATNNDNGFVSMFLLLVPPTACLLSVPLSWWIPALKYTTSPTFFLGLALIAAPLLAFSLKSLGNGALGGGERA